MFCACWYRRVTSTYDVFGEQWCYGFVIQREIHRTTFMFLRSFQRRYQPGCVRVVGVLEYCSLFFFSLIHRLLCWCINMLAFLRMPSGGLVLSCWDVGYVIGISVLSRLLIVFYISLCVTWVFVYCANSSHLIVRRRKSKFLPTV